MYGIRLDEALAEKIKDYAQRDNRSFSNMVSTILLEYIAEREKEQ